MKFGELDKTEDFHRTYKIGDLLSFYLDTKFRLDNLDIGTFEVLEEFNSKTLKYVDKVKIVDEY